VILSANKSPKGTAHYHSILAPKATQTPSLPQAQETETPLAQTAGQGRQGSANVECGDHEQASWIDAAVKRGQVVGKPTATCELRKRFDDVMEPLDRQDTSPSSQS